MVHISETILVHHGVKGRKWGVRRYQNEDGSLTAAGRKQYDKNYYVVSFIAKNGDTFDYEMYSKRITG